MRKLLVFILILISIKGLAQYDSIKISTPNSGVGDNLRTAGGKMNAVITHLNTIQIYNISQPEMAILNGALASTAEINHLVGVTSPVQTQINAKAPLASPAFTGTPTVATTINPDANDGATLGQSGTAWSDLFLADDGVINWAAGDVTMARSQSEELTITANVRVTERLILGDIYLEGPTPDVTISNTELAALDGVTSNIQTQINGISAGSYASWNIVNVKDHGVVGNGTDNDGDSIQAQIANNTVLYFPIGTYKIDTMLRITDVTNFKMIGERGTIFIMPGTTNGANEYKAIYLSGTLSDIEISNIEFQSDVSIATVLSGDAFIFGDGVVIWENININRCKFYAPDIDLNALFISASNDFVNNLTIRDNVVDSIGRIGFELYETSYANAYDSSSFKNVMIKDNFLKHTGTKGNWGLAISCAINGGEISGNHIYHHMKNQAIEVGHSYNIAVLNNRLTGPKTTRYAAEVAISGNQTYDMLISGNIINMQAVAADGYLIGLEENERTTIVNNVIYGYRTLISALNCDYGIIQGNYLQGFDNATVLLWGGTNNFLITGNRIIQTGTSTSAGGIDIHANTGDTENNIITNNFITTGVADKEYNREYVNAGTSTNLISTIEAPGGMRTIKVTIGTPGDTKTDYVFSTADNNNEQVLTLTGVLPAKCRVTSLEMVCIESVASSSGAVDMTFEAGTSSSGAEYIIAASIDDANEVRGIINPDLPAAVAMNWAAASNIYITGYPDQNWSTLTAGKWDIYIVCTDFRYK